MVRNVDVLSARRLGRAQQGAWRPGSDRAERRNRCESLAPASLPAARLAEVQGGDVKDAKSFECVI